MASQQDLEGIVSKWSASVKQEELTPGRRQVLQFIYVRSKDSTIRDASAPINTLAEKLNLTRDGVLAIINWLYDRRLGAIVHDSFCLMRPGYELFEPERETLSRVVTDLHRIHTRKGYTLVTLPLIAKVAGFGGFVLARQYLEPLKAAGIIEMKDYEQGGKRTDIRLTTLGRELAVYLKQQARPAAA